VQNRNGCGRFGNSGQSERCDFGLFCGFLLLLHRQLWGDFGFGRVTGRGDRFGHKRFVQRMQAVDTCHLHCEFDRFAAQQTLFAQRFQEFTQFLV
jgi:hypothetical protein